MLNTPWKKVLNHKESLIGVLKVSTGESSDENVRQ
jgi:hypothetical protein